MKRLLAACAVAMCVSAHATTFSTDFTDLWYNANESGWGANVVQQDNVLFMTFFVYGTNGASTWYVAPATVNSAPSGFTFTGPLYQTNGPWFGGAFNPNAVTVRQVGTATFTGNAVDAATLVYSVDGVSVTKSLSRQTWRADDLTGSYLGATVGTYSGCANNGYVEDPAIFTVTHTGTTIKIVAQSLINGAICTYTGSYTQAGRMGSSSGSLSCPTGSGSYTANEIETTITALNGRAGASFGGGCQWNGRFGGLFRGS